MNGERQSPGAQKYRAIRAISFIFFVLMSAFLGANTALASQLVVVSKEERTLMLFERGQLVKSYKISLGKNPKGHKERQGDNRTPEGKYFLTWTNNKSKYYKSLHVTYPNDSDRSRAWSKGVSPGGDIKIHGLPNKPIYDEDIYMGLNWTNGCIAMSNQDMDDLLAQVQYKTPIYIIP